MACSCDAKVEQTNNLFLLYFNNSYYDITLRRKVIGYKGIFP